jgi:poly(hydroxyalkanoate) depolymerase family esterase
MNPRFQQLMHDATRLTRQGDLAASLAAIRSALAIGEPAHAAGGDVIDVEARVLPEAAFSATEPAARPATSPSHDLLAGSYRNKAGARDYKLFVPPDQPGRPRALIVMLHGCTQNPEDFAAGTRMNEVAVAHNAFVLYPAQAQQANAQRCWNWFKHNHQARDRGEPSILAGMTREIIDRYDVDADRVFIAGLSAGGAMAAIMAHTYPDLYAAVGIHSGLAAGAARDLPSALAAMQGRVGDAGPAVDTTSPRVRTIVFHGDADATVHPRNGAQIAARHAGQTTLETQRTSSGGRACTRHLQRMADGSTLVEHWVVHGAGHAWSGGSAAGSYADPQGPNASEEMARFFFASLPS